MKSDLLKVLSRNFQRFADVCVWLISLLFPYQHWPVFVEVKDLLTLVPPLVGLKGNLEMTLASRLSTAVSGHLDIRGGHNVRQARPYHLVSPGLWAVGWILQNNGYFWVLLPHHAVPCPSPSPTPWLSTTKLDD